MTASGGPARGRGARGRGGPRARVVLGAAFVAAGLLHFVIPRSYEAIVPDWLPAHHALVLLSGAAEIAGGLGVMRRASARPAGWWLVLTLLTMFPANVQMALDAERFDAVPEPLLWARLPLQGAFLWWVWRVAIAPARG
jgi:uncharacterized membrane protein